MDLSQVKLEILEALLGHGTPVKAAVIAKELKKETPAVQMHLIGLVKMGVAESPSKGQYLISSKGKHSLGLPEVTKEKALEILAKTPHERAFHFYAGIGKPLNVYAYDLLDFSNKACKVSIESFLFHFERGDFEAWFKSLGDLELCRKTASLKNRKLVGEDLREQIVSIVKKRCMELSEKAGLSVPI